ncbi:MAG: 2-oxoacid:acceptor oxidoreductase family protein [Desulfobacterales bacterium]|jgi:indolepyruvate ferredoxin oxidoreductase beta subunit|nr:2-oxoacid:acceptor oxidoreductase family protein [Desulfobacterales bacterium]
MDPFNIYLIGVGGQGIGLLSEVILRAADHAGHPVKGVDTHGLAQRGGIVKSQVRIGAEANSPLIMRGAADLVVALERHEALRGMNSALRDKGTLLYYNTVWQPLAVRLNRAEEVGEETIQKACAQRNIRVITVFQEDLTDARMQNIVLLAHIDKLRLIPKISTPHYHSAMSDLMDGRMLEKNRALFDALRG